MHIAAIIPYRRQADDKTLRWVLEGYAQQRLDTGSTLEVHVGLDGSTDTAVAMPPSPHRMYVHGYSHRGAAGVRNALVAQVPQSTELLVFGNADARPEPEMIQQHALAMAPLPPRSLVLGSAPWVRIAPTVIDALIDTTPMIFSYCHAQPHCWYPFRIAYSLNLSVRYPDFVDCGGFHELIRPYYYEDLAFGCRVLGPQRQGLFYEPAARVWHHHPMNLEQYLDREELLGIMAPVLARICPEAFQVLMAQRSVEQIARDFSHKLTGELRVYRKLYAQLDRQLALSADTLGQGAVREQAIERLYQLHIPVKLLAFRLGFLRGLELADDQRWQERKPAGLWRKYLEEPVEPLSRLSQ